VTTLKRLLFAHDESEIFAVDSRLTIVDQIALWTMNNLFGVGIDQLHLVANGRRVNVLGFGGLLVYSGEVLKVLRHCSFDSAVGSGLNRVPRCVHNGGKIRHMFAFKCFLG